MIQRFYHSLVISHAPNLVPKRGHVELPAEGTALVDLTFWDTLARRAFVVQVT